MPVRILRTATALLAVALLTPVLAGADGDPASDTLLAQNVFYPYSPTVSPSLQRTLDGETSAAAHAHFPIKVAIIASQLDLGVIPQLFHQPQTYAEFLEQEISYQHKQFLLVVMPSGYGVQGLGSAATLAAGSLAKPAGSRTDDLVHAAIVAVPKLAAAAGHPIGRGVTSGSAGSGSTALIVAILALAATGTAALVIVIRRRHPQPG